MLYSQVKGGERMSVGDNIRRLRKEKGWTQAELAKVLNVSQQMIGQFENNKNPPKIETVEKIASALGVTPFDLMGFDYWDQQNPDAGKEYTVSESWDNYLKSMGYIIQHNVSKWHWEDETADISERVQIPDEYEHTLIKDGHEAIFSDSEFEELQKGALEAIEGRFFKKVLEQQKQK